MQTVYFNSTAISRAEWHPEDGTMVVYFVKGGQTTVPNVSLAEWKEFGDAPSAGKHWNQHFKSRS
jgi:hypothetical protein